MFTHYITRQYKDSSGATVGAISTLQGPFENNYDGTVAAGASALLINWAALRASMVSLLLFANVAMTIKTNSSSAPQDTIVLVANQVIVWDPIHDGIGECPFSGDVSALYLYNSGAADGTLKIRSIRSA